MTGSTAQTVAGALARSMALALATGLAALIPGAAAAQDCPRGAAPLDAGVTVQFDGLQITYSRGPDGRIRERESYEDEGSDWHYITDPIGLVFESWEVSPDGVADETTRERVTYAFDQGIPRPQAGGRWIGTETTAGAGGESYQALVTWVMDAPETLMIGACQYAVIPITETRMDLPKSPGDLPFINRYIHVQDLGISLYLGGDEAGVEPLLETPLGIVSPAQ